MGDNYQKWMKNAMKLEVEDWNRDKDPDTDSDGAFQTSTPKMILKWPAPSAYCFPLDFKRFVLLFFE